LNLHRDANNLPVHKPVNHPLPAVVKHFFGKGWETGVTDSGEAAGMFAGWMSLTAGG
jgi:hypothetical protein